MNRFRSTARDPFTLLRKRLVRETEVALLYGLRFPKRQPRIPMMEIGKGVWHPDFAEQFWMEALQIKDRDRSLWSGANADDRRIT